MSILLVCDLTENHNSYKQYCQKNNLRFDGLLVSTNDDIQSHNNFAYAVCPMTSGFNIAVSIMNKFDQIIFLKDHKNYPAKLLQLELEMIYFKGQNIKEQVLPLADKNKLTFFGCSHTHGTGHTSKITTYPYLLANTLGLDYKNFGLPGEGNYAIENLMNSFSIENSKLIVQFTDMYRVQYLENNILQKKKTYELTPTFSNSILFNEENLFYNFKQLVIRVTNRLREGNNKFVITHTANTENEYSVLCTEFLYGFKEFTSNIGTCIDTAEDNAHYGSKSHKLWAERLHDKWIELYGEE